MEPITGEVAKKFLNGTSTEIQEDYGGLGAHFLDTLFENLNKIHQIDLITGITETNGSVRSRAIQVAHELHHLGILENDIVLVCCRSHADQTIVVLACLLIGCIVAPIDSEFHHKESVELVGQLKPKLCFCDLRTLKQMEQIFAETGITSKMIHFGEQHQYAMSFRKLLMNRQYPEQFKPVIIEQPKKRVAFILATQGTTGTPKLVCLSHHFVYAQILTFLSFMDSPEKIISFYPLSWVMQLILMCTCFKVPVVRVLTGSFVERTACKLIHDLKIDYAFFNTDMALQLVEHVAVKDFNLSCLKCIFIGGLTTTPYDIKRLVQRLPRVKFSQMYCTTEVGVVIGCPFQDYNESLDRIGTVGKVLPNCKLRIVDINSRNDVEVETAGELLIASDNMMLGYYKNISVTKLCTQQGFFKSGDIARFDGNGWIFIEGRISDLIMINGLLESPRELEDVILMHPFVKDAAVISNEREIVACVIVKADTNLDENKLLKFISEKKMLPRNFRINFMADFPTTPLGKLRRNLLKDEVLSVKIEHSTEHLEERK